MKRLLFLLLGIIFFFWLVFFVIDKIQESPLYQSIKDSAPRTAERRESSTSSESEVSSVKQDSKESSQKISDLKRENNEEKNGEREASETGEENVFRDPSITAGARGAHALFYLLSQEGIGTVPQSDLGTMKNIQSLLALLDRDDLSQAEMEELQQSLLEADDNARALFDRLTGEEEALAEELETKKQEVKNLETQYLAALENFDNEEAERIFAQYQKKRGELCEKQAELDRIQTLKNKLIGLAKGLKGKAEALGENIKNTFCEIPDVSVSTPSINTPSLSGNTPSFLPNGGYILGESTPIPRPSTVTPVTETGVPGGQILYIPEISDLGNNRVRMNGVLHSESRGLEMALQNW